MVLGIITYPLYLLHQNVGFMVFNALYPAVNPHFVTMGTMALMIAMSLFIHVVFERAMARQLRRVLDHSSNKIAVLFTGGFERLKSYRPK